MNIVELKKQVEDGVSHISGQVNNFTEKEAARIDRLKQRLDEMEKANNRIGSPGRGFKKELLVSLDSVKAELAAMKEGKQKEVRLSVKGDMTTGNSYTGEVIGADYMPGVHFDPDRPTHIRQFLPQAPTSSDTVRYVQETSYTDGTSGQAEGEAKGQTSFTAEAKDAKVVTRATFLRVTRQMLDDTNWLTAYINQRTPKKLFIDEDKQILYGDGTGENVEGISEVAQGYTSVLTNISNKFDVLVNAVAQAATEDGEYQANLIVVNPIDYWDEALKKGNDGHYIHPASVRTGTELMRFAGVRVVPNTAVLSNDFFVGDFMLGATLSQRQGINIRFFEQDADNVTTNKVTVRIEQRFALPIHNPNAFVYGDFATALPS